MVDGQAENPESPQEQARRLGIELPGAENTEAAASPATEEASQETPRPEEPASAAPAPEPAPGPSEEMESQRRRLAALEERAERAERDYGASSKEAKRLAERVKLAESRLGSLKEKYALEELNDWTPTPPDPEDAPITRRDIEAMRIQNEWQNAESNFFASEKNADLANPVVKRWVIASLFTPDGQLKHPNKSPQEAFKAAAKECRAVLDGERLKGRQEGTMAKQQVKNDAVAESTAKAPEVKPKPAEEEPGQNAYMDLWEKHKRRLQQGK
jgi:hypothetical protein